MATQLTTKFLFLGLIFLATMLEVAGDMFFKKWSIEQSSSLLYTGGILYAIGSIFWIISLKYELLSRAISIFTILKSDCARPRGCTLFQGRSFGNKQGWYRTLDTGGCAN